MNDIVERRREERERRRLEIVEAAERVYAETGWEALTVDHVARRARLSRALVYVYFRDRDDLHLAIVERSLERLRACIQSAADDARSGLDKVEAIGRAYVEFARDSPHCFDACSRYHARPSGDTSSGTQANACAAAAARTLRVISACIRQGMADASMRSDLGAPMLTSIALWGFMHGMIQLADNKSDEIERTGIAIPQLLQHSFDMLRRALAAVPGP